jgi:GNAT superfamily N-acetyltransferase
VTIELARPTAADAEVLGDICYRAFKDISDKHGFPTDFTTPALAQMVVSGCIANEHGYATGVKADGRWTGSNFFRFTDEVAGVGPVSVDPERQSGGVGRLLMEDLLKAAKEQGIERVRLMQDSFNMISLALYASLGFDTKHPCALLAPVPKADASCRPMEGGDLDIVEGLSREMYKVSRRNDAGQHIGDGMFKPFVRERGGRVVGYLVIGMVGHGCAESNDDLVALAQHAATEVPAEIARCFCPLREGELYRKFLEAGFRNRKVMNLMTMGPYDEPEGSWMPSVGY